MTVALFFIFFPILEGKIFISHTANRNLGAQFSAAHEKGVNGEIGSGMEGLALYVFNLFATTAFFNGWQKTQPGDLK